MTAFKDAKMERYRAYLKSKLDEKLHEAVDEIHSLMYSVIGVYEHKGKKYYYPAMYDKVQQAEAEGWKSEWVWIERHTYNFRIEERRQRNERIKLSFAVVNQQKNTYKDLNVGSLIAQYI